MDITELLFAMEVKKEADKMMETFLSKNRLGAGRKFSDTEIKEIRQECTRQVLVEVYDTADDIKKLTN